MVSSNALGGNVRHRKPGAGSTSNADVKDAPKSENRPRSCFGLCWKLTLAVITLPLFLVLVIIVWPANFNPKPFHYKPAPKFENALTPNKLLAEAAKLFDGRLFGPEAIAIRNGVLYTGTSDGRVLRIENDTISTVTTTGITMCEYGDSSREQECGRPLGMRIDNQGNLIVIDSVYGLYRIDVTTGVKEMLFSTREVVDGKRSIFLNDVTVTSEGVIYLSDSSTTWTRPEFLFLGLENNPDGRIIRVDPTSGTVKVVVNNVHANGIELSKDESELVIADTVRSQILRYHLSGPNQGKLEVLSDNLPGNPDNIRRSSGGGYWVALTAVRNPDKPQPLWEKLGPYPWTRGVLCKLIYMWSKPPLSTIRKKILPAKGNKKKPYGLVLETDSEGHIVRSLHDPTGNIVGISHVEENNGSLYLGSISNSFIGKFDLKVYSDDYDL